MSEPILSMHGLHLRFALARLGWFNGIAIALCVLGAISWAWVIPNLNGQLRTHQGALQIAQKMLQSNETAAPEVEEPLEEIRLADFYDALGEKRFSEQQIKTLFALAQKAGLGLNQAEYKTSANKNGNFYTYQMIVPVKGPYRSIRQFCEHTLLAIPFASLDEVSFKRDAIASNVVEARLRFTLYLSDQPSPAAHREAASALAVRS